MGMLRLLTRHRQVDGERVPPAPDVRRLAARSPRPMVATSWAAPDPSELSLPTVRTCADIPWAMIQLDTWPDGEAKFHAQAFLNQCWYELRCCDRPVPFGCDELPYPDVPSHIDWSA